MDNNRNGENLAPDDYSKRQEVAEFEYNQLDRVTSVATADGNSVGYTY